MASHHQHGADILPFGPPVDYPRRGVRFIHPRELRAVNDKPDLIEQLREQHRIEAERRAELDADCRVIGYGLLAGYLAAIIFRIAQVTM